MDYNTLSIASLGPSTLSNSKNRPQIHYIRQSSDLIRDENTSEKKIITHITNDISDIDGARPKTTKERNYVSKSLFVDDIDGAKARFKDRFLQTKRHVNPLVPEYSLPSAQVAPSESQPFRRDNLMIDDIEGTRTSHRKIFPGRDPLQIDDIDGTRPGWKPRHLRIRKEADPHDIFPVTENPIKKTIWRTTTRETDPLNPSYRIHNTTYATVEKSSPKKLPLYIPDNHLLMTSDIEGAQAGYLMEHNLSIPNSMRTEFRNSNFLGDIEGAQADTRKKTIQTKRCSNPLQPVYKSLDGDDLISGPVDSLVPATLIDTNTVKFKSYGVIPQNNQWNSSTQSKESLTQSKSNHHHHHHNHNSSNNVHNNNNNSNNNSRKPSAQILTIDQHTDDSNDIKFTYSFDTNQSTTSQYLYPSSSQQNERIDLENLKSYADKLNNDLLISSSSSSSNNNNNNNYHNPIKPSQSANNLPRRSLSASQSHPRGVSPIVNPHHTTYGSSNSINSSTSALSLSLSRNRIQSAREKDRQTNNQSNNSSRQSTGRLHSNPSARRQMDELNNEINAVRNL